MRIALLTNLAPRKLGSLEQWLTGFAGELAVRGHEVTVYGHEPLHPDVGSRLLATGAAWRTVAALSASPVEAISELRRFDVIHADLWSPREGPMRFALAAWPARILFADHLSDVGGRSMGQGGGVRRFLEIGTAIRIHSVAGVSDYIAARDRRRFAGAVPVRTIYNGVDLDRFTPTARRSEGPLRLLVAAYLLKEKGVDVLLRALPLLRRDVRLTIAGDGPELLTLQALSTALALDSRVTFTGLRDDVERLHAEADVFVHPARYQEAFGLAMAEAMASGLPIVASRVGAVPELVIDERTGLLVPPDDHAAVAAAIERLAADRAMRQRMGDAARARAVERFSLERAIREHADWCEEPSSARRRTPRRSSIVPST